MAITNGMMEPIHDLNRPHCGVVHQPDIPLPWSDLDPGLRSRKGRLYLLCEQAVDPSWVAEIQRRYYADSSYDTLPSLSAALAAVYAQAPDARHQILAVVALQGLEAFVVGAPESSVWVLRPNEARMVLPPRMSLNAQPLGDRSPGQPLLHSAQIRLFTGDTLVMVGSRDGLVSGSLAKVVRSGTSAESIARAVAHQARKSLHRPVPVTAIRLPGFTPIPDLGPSKEVAVPRASARAPMGSPREASPIWPALALAFVAIAVSLWFRKPQLSHENIQKMAMSLLTPPPSSTVSPGAAPAAAITLIEPTFATLLPVEQSSTVAPATPVTPKSSPRPTATPTPSLTPSASSYAIPELLSPREGEDVRADGVTLKWSWIGSLAEDEYFDVRLWRIGTDAKGIAWTKEPEYIARHLETGWYSWAVAVVRGHDGMIERELCQESPAMSFYYVGDMSGRSATEASTRAPTRVSPDDRPTRVSPDLDDHPQASQWPPVDSAGDKE